MNDEEREGIARAAAFGAAFIPVLVKLRQAELGLHGVSLQHSEVKVILDALRLLKEPRLPKEPRERR